MSVALRFLIIMASVVGSSPCDLLASGTASFQGIGFAGTGTQSFATSVSGDGLVVAGGSFVTFPQDDSKAIRWSPSTGALPLGFVSGPGELSYATAVSYDGSVIVGNGYAADDFVFRWTVLGGMQALSFRGDNEWPKAFGVSDDGDVVAGHRSDADENDAAVRWTAAGPQALGVLSGNHSRGYGISGDGLVVVGGSGNPWQACRWTSPAPIPLGLGPNGFSTNASDASLDGTVIVGVTRVDESGIEFEAMRWTSATGVVSLGDLPGGDTQSTAHAVSADGSIVVGTAAVDFVQRAFIWDSDNDMRDLKLVLTNDFGLDLTGWTLHAAEDVSADGLTIVGWGTNPQGFTEGWIARLPPTDADEDGLLDTWETQGKGIDINHDGTIDLDLYAQGARPNHKDLFVEIDHMSGTIAASLTPVVTAFANAPVSNPDGSSGVNLHLQIDDTNLPLSSGWNPTTTWLAVDNLKSIFFGTAAERGSSNSANILAAKRKAYRYGVYADTSDGYALGTARAVHANDFVMFNGMPDMSDPDYQQAVFMHELGHALGLQHGGGDNVFNKPNYFSVMNYLHSLPYNAGSAWKLDYSHGTMLNNIEEFQIDESVFLIDPTGHNNGQLTYYSNALCPPPNSCVPLTPATYFALGYTIGSGPKDINGDQQITSNVCSDLNYFGTGSSVAQGGTPTPCDLMADYNDWANLIYALVDETSPLAGDGPLTDPPVELTIAEIQALHASLPGPPCLADIDGSGAVNVDDLLAVINAWGECSPPPSLCNADITPLPVDSQVNVDDLLAIINAWGKCP